MERCAAALSRTLMTNSLAVRVIPCLDVDEGRVVKGTNFVDLLDAGDPVEIAAAYGREGADEIVFLDISASHQERDIRAHQVERVASELFVPLTVGGGLRDLDDIRTVLSVGADKVGLNTAALADPSLIDRAAAQFGAQCVVVAIDAKRRPTPDEEPLQWEVYTHGGRRPAGRSAVDWAREAADRGAGEILLTSMDRDGTGSGFDLELLGAVGSAVPVPVIASGGGGSPQDLCDAVLVGGADAVLAAGIFHFGRYSIREVKEYMAAAKIQVRL